MERLFKRVLGLFLMILGSTIGLSIVGGPLGIILFVIGGFLFFSGGDGK
jgi:hypothetical protein